MAHVTHRRFAAPADWPRLWPLLGLLAWIGGPFLAGCESAPDIAGAEQRLQVFARDGATTREQVLLKFGAPSAEFEGGRILTYLLTVGDEGEMRPVSRQQAILPEQAVLRWRGVSHNLVLVFRPDGVLEKHALVKVNP